MSGGDGSETEESGSSPADGSSDDRAPADRSTGDDPWAEAGTGDDRGVNADENGGNSAGEDAADADGGSGLLRRSVPTLIGADVIARLGPEALETLAPYLLGVTRVFETGVAEATIVLFGLVIRYPSLVWGLSWLALVAIAMVYVPELVRPERTDWPSGLLGRLVFAVPVVWVGFLTEAAFRRVLAATVGETTAPFVAPLTRTSLGGTLLVALGLFAWVYHDSGPGGSPHDHSLVGYLLRATVLLVVLGVFFASFSMLSPYSELFAIALFAYALVSASATGAASDPAERLVESAATVWERPAQAVMSLYVTGALAVVVLALLAVRVRVPANMFARAPLPTTYLVAVGAMLLLYTVVYCERALRPFRRNYDPETEPTTGVEGGFFPATILISLLLAGYVYGDPLVLPGVLEIAVGLVTVFGVPLLAGGFSLGNVYGLPSEDDLETEAEDDDLRVEKTVEPVEGRHATRVSFALHSDHDDPVAVVLTEELPFWARSELVRESTGSVQWDLHGDRISYETTLRPGETERAEYFIATPESVTADELLRGFSTTTEFRSSTAVENGPAPETTTEDDGGSNDADGAETADDEPSPGSPSSRGAYEYNMPRYHLPPVAIGVFAALLAAPAPLSGEYVLTGLLDGSLFRTDLVRTLTRSVAVFLLVTLPYVPFGATTHRGHLQELYDELGIDEEVDPDEAGVLSHYTWAGVVTLLALGVALVDVSMLSTLPEQGLLAVLSLVAVLMLAFPPDGEGLFWRGVYFLSWFVFIGPFITATAGLIGLVLFAAPLLVVAALVYGLDWLVGLPVV